MGSTSNTSDKDLGFKRIVREMKRAGNSGVDIGWFEGPHPNSNLGMAGVAAVHEFGAPSANIPERATMRPTVDKNREKYRSRQRALAGKWIDGTMSKRAALNTLGSEIEADLKDAITNFQGAELAPSTIAAKGSIKPLIDTGAMRDALTHKVFEK